MPNTPEVDAILAGEVISQGLYVMFDHVAAELDRRLDAEIAKNPDAAKDREVLRASLVNYFIATGTIPPFTLEKKEP